MTALLASPARQPVALLADRAELALMLKREGKGATRSLVERATHKEHDFPLVLIEMEELSEPFPRWGINE